jgi:hypothetical protein
VTAAAVLVLAAVMVAVAVAYELTGDRQLRSRTKRRALVTTHDGAWFSGVLLAHDRRSVVLVNATTETEDGAHAEVDGEVLILTEDIAHIQFP